MGKATTEKLRWRNQRPTPSLPGSPHSLTSSPTHGCQTMYFNPRALIASAVLVVLISPAAPAAGLLPFDAVRFEEVRKAGKPIVLQVTATWCGPCQRLRKVVGGFLENPEFKDLVIFDADFDANKDALVKLNAHTVTTLVVYRDNIEILRSSGETRSDAVGAVLRKAM
jgi:thioredoxin 1